MPIDIDTQGAGKGHAPQSVQRTPLNKQRDPLTLHPQQLPTGRERAGAPLSKVEREFSLPLLSVFRTEVRAAAAPSSRVEMP